MRVIEIDEIVKKVSELCVSSNCNLNQDVLEALNVAENIEESPVGRAVLGQLLENSKLAREKQMPICQDTGMTVVFVELGQEVHVVGGLLEDAVNLGVRQGYEKGCLRKSVVADPLLRINTNDNTPAVIYVKLVAGENLKITVAPKGFGSENMSSVRMLKPSDGVEGVKQAVLQIVENAGSNACPPMVVGVGIGSTFEGCALLAKKALLRPVGSSSPKEHVKALEKELLEKINATGIGPQGLGGNTTALAVNIETFATHIAGLPVAVNISCHVTRHESCVL